MPGLQVGNRVGKKKTGTAAAGMRLSANSFNENSAIGTDIGTLSVVNATGTPSFTLVDDAGGKVSLTGAALKVAASVDYETTPSFNITVSVSGTTPAISNRVFSISVIDVYEPPPVEGAVYFPNQYFPTQYFPDGYFP